MQLTKWFVLTLGIFLAFAVRGQGEASAPESGVKRVYIQKIKMLKRKAKWARINYTLANTGSESVNIGEDKTAEIVFFEDLNLEKMGLTYYKGDVVHAIRQQGGIVEPKGIYNNEVKVDFTGMMLPDGSQPSSQPKAEKPKEEIVIKKAKTREDWLKERSKTDKMKSPEKTKPTIAKAKPKTKPEPAPQPAKENPAEEGLQINPEVANATASSDNIVDGEGCADLVIESLKILKLKKKKYADIEVTIKNIGTAPAPLLGEKKKRKEDNIAFRYYFSGDNKLNKGDLIGGGAFLGEFDKNPPESIPPGGSYTGKIKAYLAKQSGFTHNLILVVDAFQGIQECNEANNSFYIVTR